MVLRLRQHNIGYTADGFRDIALLVYWGHEFDLSRLRDVIDHVTIW